MTIQNVVVAGGGVLGSQIAYQTALKIFMLPYMILVMNLLHDLKNVLIHYFQIIKPILD